MTDLIQDVIKIIPKNSQVGWVPSSAYSICCQLRIVVAIYKPLYSDCIYNFILYFYFSRAFLTWAPGSGDWPHCTALHCTALHCIALHCIAFALHCIVLYYIVLYFIVFYCIVLYCIVLYCIVLYCIVLYCIVLYYIVKQERVTDRDADESKNQGRKRPTSKNIFKLYLWIDYQTYLIWF